MAMPRLGGTGLSLSVVQQEGLTNAVTLQASEIYMFPAGTYMVTPGPYTWLQWKDPVQNNWTVINYGLGSPQYINSDGTNFRLANLSGCVVGAIITNAGSGYTSAPTLTDNGGSATYSVIVGGAVDTTVTVSAKGSSYTSPPNVLISAPPAGGLQATAHCTLSSGTIGSVVVDNQGAGYSSAPTVTFVNDPRDTTGSGATATTALTGSGTVTGIIVTNPGTAVTSVPALTFAGGGGSSAAATAIMNFTVTGFTTAAAGAGYGTSQPIAIISNGGIVAGTGAYTNPFSQNRIMLPRQARIAATSTAGGALTNASAVIVDAGLGLQAVPTGVVIAAGTAIASGQGQATLTVGGTTDTSYIQLV